MLQKHKKAGLRLLIGSRIQLPSKRCDFVAHFFTYIFFFIFEKEELQTHFEHISPFRIQTYLA